MTHYRATPHITPYGPDMLRRALETCPDLADLDGVVNRLHWLGFEFSRMNWSDFNEARMAAIETRARNEFAPFCEPVGEMFA